MLRFALPFLAVVLFQSHQLGRSGQDQSAPGSQFAKIYRYDTPGVRLKGILVQRSVSGASGDTKAAGRSVGKSVLVLKLPRLVAVKPAPRAGATGSVNMDPAENVSEIELLVNRSQLLAARTMVGHKVLAVGTLNESISANRYTKVWLQVKQIEPN